MILLDLLVVRFPLEEVILSSFWRVFGGVLLDLEVMAFSRPRGGWDWLVFLEIVQILVR